MKKCIIITTINEPSEQVIHYSTIPDWTLIIVGDTKTNDLSYKNIPCVYLGIEQQKNLYPKLHDKVPLKSYTRKMFGYLYAIQNKYDIIYDTDDDNKYIMPLDDFDSKKRTKKLSLNHGFVNLYKIFTDSHIWLRGIPPNHESVCIIPDLSDELNKLEYSIIQGLVNNDPDVDAFYRINVSNKPFTFEKDPGYDILLDKYSVCPFNTQNTFWIDPKMFYAMFLPTTVTFRYTDILRGFIALFQLWKNDKTILFTMPTAYQKRNEHDLMKDLESEISMYDTAEQVIVLLKNNSNATIQEVYKILHNQKIVTEDELEVLNIWLELIEGF